MTSASEFPMEPKATFFAMVMGKERMCNSLVTIIKSSMVLNNCR